MIEIKKSDIVYIHAELCKLESESPNIINPGLLDSAINSAYQTFGGNDLFASDIDKICRVSFGIISNHPFEDGNKRTGIAVLLIYLTKLNTYLNATCQEIVRLGIDVASGKLDFDQYSKFIKDHQSAQESFKLLEDYKSETPFSLKNTGFPYYNQFFDPEDAKYLREKKGLVGRIEWMSPEEYLEECAKIFGSTYQAQFKQGSEQQSIDGIEEVYQMGKKIWLPYLNRTVDWGQEGRHRAVWAIMHDIEKIPVLVVDYESPEAKRKFERKELLDKLFRRASRALNSLFQYSYYTKEELKEETDYLLDREFDDIKGIDSKLLDDRLMITFEGDDLLQIMYDDYRLKWKDPSEKEKEFNPDNIEVPDDLNLDIFNFEDFE